MWQVGTPKEHRLSYYQGTIYDTSKNQMVERVKIVLEVSMCV